MAARPVAGEIDAGAPIPTGSAAVLRNGPAAG